MRELILSWIEKGLDVKTELEKYLKRNLTYDDFKLIVIDALGLTDKFKQGTLTIIEREALNEVFKTLEPDFARTTRGLLKNVVKIVNDSTKNDETKKQLRERIQSVIGRYRNYAETIARTAQNAYFNTILDNTTDDEDVFTYTGVSAERPFCKNLLALAKNGKTWTKAEIKKLDNKQGLDPFLYCGGFNCRHKWRLKEIGSIQPKIDIQEIEIDNKNLINDMKKRHNLNTVDVLDDYDTFIAPKRSTYLNDLSKETRNSLEYFGQEGYETINASIRRGQPDKHAKQIIDNDISYILDRDTTLFRGEFASIINADSLKALRNKISDIEKGNFKADGLFSASGDFDVAKKFSQMTFTNSGGIALIYSIKLKKGSKVGFGTDFEREIIFNPNTKFRATKITKYNVGETEKIFIEIEPIE